MPAPWRACLDVDCVLAPPIKYYEYSFVSARKFNNECYAYNLKFKRSVTWSIGSRGDHEVARVTTKLYS